MTYNQIINILLESVKRSKWEVRYDGKKYNTYATTKKAALANIGARIAKEMGLKREIYPKIIRKVVDSGFAKIIEEKCWKGYTQIGMKKKGKRTVPNCVKKKAKKTK
jgi:hypothetical protein